MDSAFAGSVTVALSSNPGGSTLGGATSVGFVNGLATLAGLTLNEPGQGYTFVAVGNGLAPSPSLAALTLSVTPAPAATQLVIISPLPANLTAGQSFGLTVAAESASGNVDTAFAGSVVVALASNPAGGILGGTTTATLVSGVASFTGLTLDQAGSGYTLQAASGGLCPRAPRSSVSLRNGCHAARGDLLAPPRHRRRPAVRVDRGDRGPVRQPRDRLQRQSGHRDDERRDRGRHSAAPSPCP